MSSNKKKEGAIAMILVLMMPIILMLFAVMLDGILTKNIKNSTQRYLDASSLTAANLAGDNACIIDQAVSDAGVNLFTKNMTSSGLKLTYTIQSMRNAQRDANGIVQYVVNAESRSLTGGLFFNFDYKYRFTVESTAVCYTK